MVQYPLPTKAITPQFTSRLTIQETDEAGNDVATYVLTTDKSNRVDVLLPTDLGQTGVATSGVTSRLVSCVHYLISIFLPSGFPHSVRPDYVPYQIYDSLQAFSSSIAGLLASRAVLEGLGVGDITGNMQSPVDGEPARVSPSATAIVLLNILQESAGRLATILFAHRLGTAFEPEAKRYRLLADIFNDVAMILDCLSPIIPASSVSGRPAVWWSWYVRVLTLSTASTLRALCGVAAGSSKAILSQHFAIEEHGGSVGELNAKDASQETVISLLGMWTGSVVVSIITSRLATWVTLLVLLTIHLVMNWMAVRSVCMPTLNRQRANIVFAQTLATGIILKPADVAERERVFEEDGVLRSAEGVPLGHCRIGSGLSDLLSLLKGTQHSRTNSVLGVDGQLESLLRIFEKENYLVYCDISSSQYVVVLKSLAGIEDQLKGWNHAFLIAATLGKGMCRPGTTEPVWATENIGALIEQTSRQLNKTFSETLTGLRQAGWDTSVGALETRPGKRIASIGSD